jgi:hypothetical protein
MVRVGPVREAAAPRRSPAIVLFFALLTCGEGVGVGERILDALLLKAGDEVPEGS